MIPFLALAVCCVVPAVSTDKVAVFAGLPGGSGDVWVFDESSGPPVLALADVRLMPIDFAGRTSIQEMLPDRPRLQTDVPVSGRLSLPEAGILAGSLYRYVRQTSLGETRHGVLLIDGAGARSLLELAEPCRGCDPFESRIAVASAGDAILLATLPIAGGDLYEIDLASGLATNRTSAVPPLAFHGSGLALASQWGVAASATGVWRFDRSATGDAQPVVFAPQPAWFAGELVLSASGEWAATIAGEEQALAYAWVFSMTSAPVRMSNLPAALSGAGFLPEALDGPWLAVSDDGASCAWRTGSAHSYTTEVYFAQTASAPAALPVHVTQDALFEPYIDEVGQFLFNLAGQLLFGAGDPAIPGHGGLTHMDFFELTPLPGVGVVTLRNLSNTSGQAFPPFIDYPKLVPKSAVWCPAGTGFLVHDESTHEPKLLAVEDGASGVLELAEDVLAFSMVSATPGGLVSFLESEEDDETGIYNANPSGSSMTQLLELPQGSDFERGVVGAGRWLGWVSAENGMQVLRRLDLQTGTLEKFTDRPLSYGPTLAMTAGGGLAFSLQAAATSEFILWPVGAPPRRLACPGGGFGFVLP